MVEDGCIEDFLSVTAELDSNFVGVYSDPLVVISHCEIGPMSTNNPKQNV